MTRDEILALEVCGNYTDDQHVITTAEAFIIDSSNSLGDRCDVIEFLEEKVLGIDVERATEGPSERYLQGYLDMYNS